MHSHNTYCQKQRKATKFILLFYAVGQRACEASVDKFPLTDSTGIRNYRILAIDFAN